MCVVKCALVFPYRCSGVTILGGCYEVWGLYACAILKSMFSGMGILSAVSHPLYGNRELVILTIV